MATSGTGHLTTEQFLAMPEQYDSHGNRIKMELIAGEIVPVPFASSVHDLIKNNVAQAVLIFLAAQTHLELRVLVEIGYDVTDQDAFAPDVCVVRKSRLRENTARILKRAPEIAIEVVSPSDTASRLRYRTDTCLANGSRSVWIVYPEARSVEVHTLQGSRDFTGDQLLEDATLPGFSQPASAFFEGV